MTITVSISDFRQNISDYIAKVKAGHTVVLKDEKKNEEVAQILGKKKFNTQEFHAMLERVAGTFTAENHPEWATRAKVEKWLRNSRLADDRNFNVPA